MPWLVFVETQCRGGRERTHDEGDKRRSGQEYQRLGWIVSGLRGVNRTGAEDQERDIERQNQDRQTGSNA